MLTVKKIVQLSEGMENIALVAIVIAKSDPRLFSGSLARSGGRYGVKAASEETADGTSVASTARGVLTLTLRDSERDTINCTVWAAADIIVRYDETISIGDVLDVQKPQVNASFYGRSEQYSPRVTSPFSLTVNEQAAGNQIAHHAGGPDPYLSSLIRMPLVRPEETIPLADLVASGAGCSGETFNVLAVVRSVRPARQIRIARRNESRAFREVVLMDQSHAGVLLKLWSAAYIRWADRWQPLATVLLIVDVRTEYSDYHRSVGLTIDRKTIIIQDPNIPQVVARLLRHAKDVPMQTVDVACSLSTGTIDPATINTVMTVQQILDRSGGTGSQITEEDQFTALCYAVITRLDLDGPGSRTISHRCGHCQTFVARRSPFCPKEDCPGFRTPPALESFFDLTVDLTDHTGTLVGCRMVSAVAETVLRCDVTSFERKTEQQRTALKWMYLLDRCAVRLVVKRRTATRFQQLFSIVGCTLIDPLEVESKLKVY
ncbi:hypothetical protein AND_007232 [Anopheles darlingi]|uniref:MEIOB-like N-terminal domain-containing protein n=1 Tax=Anopheles darlingi TaxID=43151 RepID=W5J9H8_ANODA|nr:hypothetical protein AND_007232 [Anopheles darlingi]